MKKGSRFTIINGAIRSEWLLVLGSKSHVTLAK